MRRQKHRRRGEGPSLAARIERGECVWLTAAGVEGEKTEKWAPALTPVQWDLLGMLSLELRPSRLISAPRK
jgi:hypothetical protein